MDTIVNTARLASNLVEGIIETPGITAATPHDLNVDNIQGDIILGLPKKVQRFTFYEIIDVPHFRHNLVDIVPMITSTKHVMNDLDAINKTKKDNPNKLLPLSGVNIAFSHTGLQKIGRKEDLEDQAFVNGQKADSNHLGDPRDPSNASEPDWIPPFKEKIDFVILVTGDSTQRVTERVQEIEKYFGINAYQASVRQIIALDGNVRPGAQQGHEHFGYRDGISQPAIVDFRTANYNPGPPPVPAGIALCNNPGDPRHKRPSWATDGSFLVFRYLEQLVPEFNDFVAKNPIQSTGLPPDKGSELLGARLFGRWKSGAPIDVTPSQDDPVLANDPTRNNDFDFSTSSTQDRCPFAAHIRKTNPRSDLAHLGTTTIRRIWRQGIPYGPEVTNEERQEAKTLHSRGLLFACYQSSIDNGFSFIQQVWCNDIIFPPKLLPPTISGYDPIIGSNSGKPRDMYDPEAQGKDLKLPINFVVPKGGEYFFSPSIKTLAEVFAQVKA